MSINLPLVTVLTPVYNGEKYLGECIESILRQTYQNLEYVIVNNCSTDKSMEIIQEYASKDKRIRVMNNRQHVDVVENHNIAFRYISPQSKYCKVVSADDWLYPECIEKMVHVAEEHPSVAIVGIYGISSIGVWYAGLSPSRSVFSGREVCRLHLLDGVQVMGAPTSVLYRSDIVRSETRFFPGHALSADIAACYRVLQHYDFGFVHQVLSYIRLHDEALSERKSDLNAFGLDRIAFFAEYGRSFLSQQEYDQGLARLLDRYYYNVLASGFVKRYPKKFWNYHKSRLEEIGLKFDRGRFLRAVIYKVIDLLSNPKQTIEKAMGRRRA